MASSPVAENAHDTPELPIILPPGDSTQPTLRNLKLNHEWLIGEPIAKENERHAAVYSVLISETGQSAEDLEAHVFALGNIEPKLRKHRQRCIKRMEGRTKLKFGVHKVTIVVITTSRMEKTSVLEQEAEPHYMSDSRRLKTDDGTTSVGRVRQKTLWQAESQRIRQKQRRQAKRSAKTQQCDQRAAEDRRNITKRVDGFRFIDGEIEIFMFVAMFLKLPDTLDLSAAIPSKDNKLSKNIESAGIHETLQQHLWQTAGTLKTIEEMELYLTDRRGEIIALRRHQAEILCLEERLSKLVELKREQIQQKEGSDLLKTIQNRWDAKEKDYVSFFSSANDVVSQLLLSRLFVVWSVELTLSIARAKTASDGLQQQEED